MSFFIPWVRRGATVMVATALVMVGCGGTSSTGNAPDSGGGDATEDGHVGAGDSGGGSDTGATDTGTGGGDDSSTPTDAGGDGGCTGNAMMCRMCCRTVHATGYTQLVTAELACGCSAAVCGAQDGGAGDGGASDAGSVLDQGSCSATCTTHATPDATCVKCLDQATGTKASPGVCYTDVSMACAGKKECVDYVTCVAGCP